MTMTTANARELVKCFRETSVELGNYRFREWERLTAKERETAEELEWKLLNLSSKSLLKAAKTKN